MFFFKFPCFEFNFQRISSFDYVETLQNRVFAQCFVFFVVQREEKKQIYNWIFWFKKWPFRDHQLVFVFWFAETPIL